MRDISYAIRTFFKTPAFTIAAVLTLALAIGANTAVFTLLEAVVLRSLPVQHPEQLAVVNIVSTKGPGQGVTHPFYREVLTKTREAGDFAASTNWTTTATVNGSAERVEVNVVSGNYFHVLGVRSSIGRLIAPEDDQAPGANPVAVLSHRYWLRRFGGDPSMIGGKIEIASTSFTVIGVTEQPFFGLRVGSSPDVYVPLSMDAQVHPGSVLLNDPHVRWLTVVGRVRDGAEPILRARFNQWVTGAGAVEREFRRDAEWLTLRPAAQGIGSTVRGEFGNALWVTFALVGLVLLIGCGNIANLLLARSQQRQHEMAVRTALGASRWRLIRQMLTESILLACVGGGLGMLLAPVGIRFLIDQMPQGQRTVFLDTSVNWRILLFAVVASVLTGLIFGLMPAMRSAAAGLFEALKQSGAASTDTRTRRFTANALVAGQVAFSLVLLVAAGLFVKTLWNIRSIDAGFQRDHLLLASAEPGALGMRGERLADFYRTLMDRVSSLPGVRSTAVARIRVLSGTGVEDQLTVVGYQPKPKEDMSIQLNVVSPAYFGTMEIPLIAGRDFDAGDNSTRHGVAVINQAAARRFFPNENPIGRHVKVMQPVNLEIVGVVGDTKYGDLRFRTFPLIYLPVYQRPDVASRAALHVRFEGSLAAIVPSVESTVRAMEPRLPLYMVRTMEGDLEDLLSRERMMATLGVFFGCVALLIAAVGIYGVLMHAVARRTREIGIRMALGARPRVLMRDVIGESMTPVAVGTLIGVVLAAAGARWIGKLFYGVSWTDAPIYIFASVALVIAASIAAYLPARRATQVDPMVALRAD